MPSSQWTADEVREGLSEWVDRLNAARNAARLSSVHVVTDPETVAGIELVLQLRHSRRLLELATSQGVDVVMNELARTGDEVKIGI